MSGGSLDYFYDKVDEIRGRIQDRAGDYKRKAMILAFAAHMDKVSKALHDLEWTFSGDYKEDQFEKSVMACISKSDILDTATAQAELALKELTKAIEEAKNS